MLKIQKGKIKQFLHQLIFDLFYLPSFQGSYVFTRGGLSVFSLDNGEQKIRGAPCNAL